MDLLLLGWAAPSQRSAWGAVAATTRKHFEVKAAKLYRIPEGGAGRPPSPKYRWHHVASAMPSWTSKLRRRRDEADCSTTLGVTGTRRIGTRRSVVT